MAGPPDSRSRAFSLICAAEARHFLALGEPSDFVACRKATLDLAFHDYARLAYGMPQPPPASLSQSIRSITQKVRVFGTTNVAGPEKRHCDLRVPRLSPDRSPPTGGMGRSTGPGFAASKK